MRVTGILKRTAIFATVGVALSIIPAAGASASNSTASSAAAKTLWAWCDFRDREAKVKVYYTPRNSDDEIDEIGYSLWANGEAQLGNKSNVRLRIRRDLPYSGDRTLWIWRSGDDIKPGSYSRFPDENVPYSSKWHVDLYVTFDVKGIDPTCLANTRSV